jgi:hypothetical protein
MIKQSKIHFKILGISLALILLMGFSTGCQLPRFKEQPADSAPVLIKVQVQFTGNSEPLVGYIQDFDIAKNGQVLQGGSSVNYLYDQNGQVLAVFNYARVECIKIVP